MNRFISTSLLLCSFVLMKANASASLELDILLIRDLSAFTVDVEALPLGGALVQLKYNSGGVVSGEKFKSLFKTGFQMPPEMSEEVGFVEGTVQPVWVPSDDVKAEIPPLYMVPSFLKKPYRAHGKKIIEWRTQSDNILYIRTGGGNLAFIKVPVKADLMNDWRVVAEMPQIYGVPNDWRAAAIEFADWAKAQGGGKPVKNVAGAFPPENNPFMELVLWCESLANTGGTSVPDYPMEMTKRDVLLQAALIFTALSIQDDPRVRQRHAERLSELVSAGLVDGYAVGLATATDAIFSKNKRSLSAGFRLLLGTAYKNADETNKKRLEEIAELLRDFEDGRGVLMSGRPHGVREN